MDACERSRNNELHLGPPLSQCCNPTYSRGLYLYVSQKGSSFGFFFLSLLINTIIYMHGMPWHDALSWHVNLAFNDGQSSRFVLSPVYTALLGHMWIVNACNCQQFKYFNCFVYLFSFSPFTPSPSAASNSCKSSPF